LKEEKERKEKRERGIGKRFSGRVQLL